MHYHAACGNIISHEQHSLLCQWAQVSPMGLLQIRYMGKLRQGADYRGKGLEERHLSSILSPIPWCPMVKICAIGVAYPILLDGISSLPMPSVVWYHPSPKVTKEVRNTEHVAVPSGCSVTTPRPQSAEQCRHKQCPQPWYWRSER